MRFIFFCLIMLLSCSLSPEKLDKPNVIFIAIDDLNDYVSCMNGTVSIPTPNIDKLAKQGIDPMHKNRIDHLNIKLVELRREGASTVF